MPLLWTAISAHGYGHAAQVTPVLNELGRYLPDLRVIIRTNVPRAFFEDRLTVPWDLHPAQLDIGCLQHGPLTMDWDATWHAHRNFHATWNARVKGEASAICAAGADLVLGNIPYLAMAAAAQAGVPAVALASLSWDEILREHVDSNHPWQTTLLDDMRRAYGRASLLLRITPGLPMPAFRRAETIGAIASPLPPARERIRDRIGVAPGDRLVLIAFGGIGFDRLPFEQMETMTGFHFVTSGIVHPQFRRSHALADIPDHFSTLLSSADVVMTKPGYGTTIEAVAAQTPVVYVRRHNFADETPIVEYLRRYGRGIELSRQDFEDARWEPALRAAVALPIPATPMPDMSGASDAADRLLPLLSTPKGS
ncbi:MAG: hypothetical protein U0412_12790 [Nitrospira sp.]